MLTAGVAVTCLTIGLVFTTGAGEYWLTLFDSFGATGLTFIAFTELVSVMYVYGHEKFTRDITVMTGVRPGLFWQITWRSVLLIMTVLMTMMMSRFVSPALMAGIILSSLYFMMSHWPTYTAWDRATATGEASQESGSLRLYSSSPNDRSPCAIPRLDHGGGRHPRHLQPGAHHLRHGESQSECLHLLTDPTQVTEALRGQDRAEVRTNKFYRVDTAASTRPMLGEFQVITLY